MSIIQCTDRKEVKMTDEIIIQNLTKIMLNYQDLCDDYKFNIERNAKLRYDNFLLERKVKELEQQVNALQENITHQLEECI